MVHVDDGYMQNLALGVLIQWLHARVETQIWDPMCCCIGYESVRWCN